MSHRLKNILLERNKYPGLELHDKLDRFAMNKYVQDRLEDFRKLIMNYKDKDVTTVNDAVDEVNKFLKTLDSSKRYNHIEGEEKSVFLPSAKKQRLHPEDIEADQTFNDAFTPVDNLFHANPQYSKKVFHDTVDDPVSGKHTTRLALTKDQCAAMEMKHGKPTTHRCQNFCAIGTEYCWYHLKNYMNLVVRPTHEHDREGKLVKQLGLFAELGLLRKQELRKIGTSINGPLFTIGAPVIYYLPEHITQQKYDDRYPKGRGPYTHCNI